MIGSIIGTGVFTMPGVLAGAGTSSILVLGVIAVGAVLRGVMFLPLVVVGVVGWFFIRAENFGPFNASGASLYSAIGIAAASRCSPSSESNARRSPRPG